MKTNTDYNDEKKYRNYPFWDEDGEISPSQLTDFLEDNGFSQYFSSNDEEIKPMPVVISDGVITVKGDDSTKRFVSDFIRKEEADNPALRKLRDKWAKTGRGGIPHIVDGLPYIGEDPPEESTTKRVKILRDKKGICYIPFKNGVVEITKDTVDLKPYKDLEKEGLIWRKSIRPHPIDISNLPKNLDYHKPIVKQIDVSAYVRFVSYAFKRDLIPNETKPIMDNNPLWEATDTEEWIEGVNGFETSIGYLIHQFHPSVPKAIIFVDSESMSQQKAKGGTGKSTSLESLKYIRNWTYIDGGKIHSDSGGSRRFMFDGVTPETQIILLDDIKKDMRFRDILNTITGPMEIDLKQKQKIVIPKDKKPKISMTSNFIIQGDDDSNTRRQHIVSFGTFLNRVSKREETNKSMSVEALCGVYLFEEFSDKDWNDFYIYNILCVQKYFTTDLITPSNESYKRALLANTVGDDTVFEWMEDWVNRDRILRLYHNTGVALSVIYKEFCDYFAGDHVLLTKWEEKEFVEKLFDYVMAREDVDWNPKQAAAGDTIRARRWRISTLTGQVDGVKIVDI